MFAPWHNQHVDEKPPQRRRHVNDERIHEELAQVSSDRLRRGRVGCAETDKKYAGHLGTHASGVLLTPSWHAGGVPTALPQMRSVRESLPSQFCRDSCRLSGYSVAA